MLVDYKDLTTVRKSVAVEIPADAISHEVQQVTSEFAKQARIPGFRPGKTPKNVVRTRFLKEIDDEVTSRLLPRFFSEAVGEKGLQAVGNPELKHMDPVVEGAPLRFDAEFEVKPPIELKEYRGLLISHPETAVGEDEVDKTLARLREQGATFRPLNDRPAQPGDFVTIDVASSGEGVESRSTEGYQAELGDSMPLPELLGALVGKSTGETASFDKTYAEDAPNEEVRGKSVHYEVVLRALQERELPELNDDFAKSNGIGETLDEMRSKIREDLARHKEHEALKAKRQQVSDQLIEAHDFEVPGTLVDEEVGKSLRNYARFLSSQGIDLEKQQIDWEKIRDDFRPEAVKQVKRQLLLEGIGKQENIAVSDAEVDAEIKRAAGTQREFAEVKHRLVHDGGYEALRLSMVQGKALDLVVREARVS
ncbi:MAG TPA: trigger factor [Thermoanaerobaculia bacterium]|nr:trigger factor [Thermoanaerobaculia bacterium]